VRCNSEGSHWQLGFGIEAQAFCPARTQRSGGATDPSGRSVRPTGKMALGTVRTDAPFRVHDSSAAPPLGRAANRDWAEPLAWWLGAGSGGLSVTGQCGGGGSGAQAGGARSSPAGGAAGRSTSQTPQATSEASSGLPARTNPAADPPPHSSPRRHRAIRLPSRWVPRMEARRTDPDWHAP
jgi:hypothetical protein